ncbi:MAG: hypothetical protein WC799_09885 [Desulfobacteraceae bacterium]
MVIFNSRLSRCLHVAFFGLFFFLFNVIVSDAAILNVPSQYATIPAAIAAGKSGDTIRVTGTVASPFTYVFAGNLSFGAKAMTLESEADNPATVILQGNNTSNSTVYITPTDVTGSTIRGITIIGARGTSNGDGGAMNIQTNIRVENCIIRDSSASKGGAVHISNAAKPTFTDCRFTNNSSSNGGAVYVAGEGGPFFTNCFFTNNNRASGNGDVVYLDASAATLTNCTITGNATDDDTIYQTGSYIPLIISNCIIDAAGGTAVNSATIFLGTQPEPYFVNSYINGSYDDSGTTIQMVYEPTRVQTAQDAFSSYPNAYVNTATFVPGFINSSSDYHLGMTSSCIGAGGGGSGSDFEGEIRPYYLSGRSDIGADQFNFCYLMNNNIQTGTHWFNVSLASGTQQISTNQAIGFWMQTGKVRFYRIIPQVSGVMRIWSSGATVDIKGVLSEDCLGDDLLATDDNGEGGVDFHLDYVYAEQGKAYYLGVINKDGAAGTYNLHAQMETDDRGNSCNTATTTLGTFDRTYFSSGYADKTATGSIDFSDDEDVYKIALTVPGTLMITSQDGTSLDEVEAVLKDAGCSVVADNDSSSSILILYNNKSGAECYLTVKKSPYNTSGSAVAYGFNVRYYPLDDRVSEVNNAISPETWSDGGVATGGSLVVSSPLTGNFTVKGNGIDIGADTFDEFYYVGKPVAGDFVLTANVAQLVQSSGVTLSAEAKAGAMMRESLDKSAKCAISSITAANGFKFNYRGEYGADGTASAGTNASSTLPEWVRIQREDNTLTSYFSNDGSTWYGYGNTGPGQAGVFSKTYDILGQTLNNKTYAMLAVTSNDPTRDMVNMAGHNNYSYRCKIDHTSSAANMPRDLVVSMSYSSYGLGTKYYICQKDHTAVDNFANAEADNRPRLGNVKVGTKDFQCIVPHTSSEASRPRAYHYVSYTNGFLGIRYYRSRVNSVNQTPYNWVGTNNTTYWTVIGDTEYNAVSSNDKQEYNSSTYYGPPNATDWPAYWTVVGTAGTSDDEWASGRQYSSAWKEYWRLDKDATTCDCGSLGTPCDTYFCAWTDTDGTTPDGKKAYGVSWLDYWSPTDYTATDGTYVTNWATSTLYETGQYATGQFSSVTLDTRDIVFIGGVGTETGQITIPGDSDIFEFDIAASGTITAQTTGCSVGHEAKISIYNFLGEKVLDNGDTIVGSGNYSITEALVTATANSSDFTAIPFTVAPGKYYLRVSALNGHTTPFEYGLTMTYTAGSDDHGDYKQNATILRKWSETVATTPLLYFKKEPGTISSASDVDYYRVDLPYKGTVKVMSDWAASSGAVVTELLDSYGNVLVSREDIRTANPHFPQSRANIPTWESALSYIVNEIVLYNSLYYRCILAASGAAQLPTNTTYWQPALAPPVDNSGIISRTVNPGSYYVRVTGAAGLAYLLSVDFDDYGNDVADASEARDHYAYNSFEGHFETAKSSGFQWSYDPDAFKLVVTSPNSYTIYTSGGSGTYGVLKRLTSDAPPVVVEVPDDNVVYEGYNGVGQNFKKKFTLPAGTYYIVTCMQDTSKIGDYTLHIDQTDDWSDTYTGTPMGNLVTDHSGVIEEPGDIDYFSFTAASTSRVRITVSGTIDIMMKLTDSSDRRLTHSSSGILEYDVTAGSTYYLSAKPQFAMNTGSYTLTYALVTPTSRDNDGNGNSQGNDYETARQLTFAGNTASYTTGGVDLEGDYDYYYFDVTGPGVLRVYTTGNTDTYGYLFLNEGGMYNLVISNDDSDFDKTDGYNFGMDYYVNSAAAQVRRFYVKVRGYAPHETGDYQLYIRFTTGTDDHGDECEASTLVRRGATGAVWENGHIRFDEGAIGITGDRDYFRIVAGPEGTNPGTVGLYTTDGATAIDSFGYLKNEMCGTLTSNDNGSGASDGENFRINYTPNCTVGVDCVPHTYYGVVKSYNDSQTGTYDLHVVANGASVAPVSTTTMAMTANGVKYFGFDAPDEGSYLSATIAGVSGYAVTPLTFTLYNGKGEVISGYENIAVTTPIYAQGLDRGIHYIKISNTGGTTGDFTLTLNCSRTGSIGFGNGAGSFTSTDQTLVMTGDGSTGFTGNSDNGYFVFTRETEGFDFIARITFDSAVGNTQAGIELREGLSADGSLPANGKHITSMLMRNSGNTAWNKVTRYRPTAGDATTLLTNFDAAGNGYYVRMHYNRGSNQFITGYSADGETWTNATAITLTFNDPVHVGFVYASGTDGTNRTVTFSNIQYTVIPFDDEE